MLQHTETTSGSDPGSDRWLPDTDDSDSGEGSDGSEGSHPGSGVEADADEISDSDAHSDEDSASVSVLVADEGSEDDVDFEALMERQRTIERLREKLLREVPVDDKVDEWLWFKMSTVTVALIVLSLECVLLPYIPWFNSSMILVSDSYLGSYAKELSSWVEWETPIATRQILANFGPAIGAGDGLWVASPNAGEWEDIPDYYLRLPRFTWTRDSALSLSSLLPTILPPLYLQLWEPCRYAGAGNFNYSAHAANVYGELLIRSYIDGQARLQTLQTRSGDLWSGGLNEPKFIADGRAFDGDWGRPQRDGPALRVLALIPYANFILDRGYPADIQYIQDKLYSPNAIREPGRVIKNDLEEVGGGWWLGGFDLWEEVDGHHLFTLLASLRALQAGTHLAGRLNDTGAADFYSAQASLISSRLNDFLSTDGLWQATIFDERHAKVAQAQAPVTGARARRKRTGLDCAFLLAMVHANGQARDLASGDPKFTLLDDSVLATLREFVKSFDGLYSINKGKTWKEGWAVGRYAEDVYNGVGVSRGNPWFICTFSVAHVLYLIQESAARLGQLPMGPASQPFWDDILDTSAHRDKGKDWSVLDFWDRLNALGQVADAFMRVARQYTAQDGGMSEQIHRSEGMQVGARDLTWSYASFLGAARARDAARGAMRDLLTH